VGSACFRHKSRSGRAKKALPTDFSGSHTVAVGSGKHIHPFPTDFSENHKNGGANPVDNTYKMRIYSRKESKVNRRILIKKLEAAGFVFYEHGGSHDKYKRGKDIEIIPRHRDINERTAKNILKKWNIT
jgi:mRNA interferase HicA